ncbi:unnamed protein product, partial [marine sediment metagenome]
YRCYSTATITVTSAYDSSGGGLVDWNYDGTISQSYVTGDVTVTTSNGSRDAWAGGLVSDNEGAILNCYARGDVVASGGTATSGGFVYINQAATTITNAYSTGATTGADGDAGFCQTNSGTITNCFWDTETSADAASDGGTGKTTAQMLTKATFTDAGWNFAGIWSILSTVNDGYPFLGNIARAYTIPTLFDDKGRVPKGARVRAYRNDTKRCVEEQLIDEYGNATFTELPLDVDVTFHAIWGGTT